MTFDTLIHNGAILTCNPHFDIIARTDGSASRGGQIQGLGTDSGNCRTSALNVSMPAAASSCRAWSTPTPICR